MFGNANFMCFRRLLLKFGIEKHCVYGALINFVRTRFCCVIIAKIVPIFGCLHNVSLQNIRSLRSNSNVILQNRLVSRTQLECTVSNCK